MPEIRVLVAAAGKGQRAGLPYPKTLYPVQGTPILVRILKLLRAIDDRPTVVVSPAGEQAVKTCLAEDHLDADLVVQAEPRGMGDAVLRFENSPGYGDAEHILLVWGDIPMLQPETVAATVETHLKHGNDFTFPTRVVDSAYTIVSRDDSGRVVGVVETRELGIERPRAGERDIGLFLFRNGPVFDTLREDLPDRLGRGTGEHGFLYVIGHLCRRGFKVEGIPIATEMDLVSLNRLSDLAGLEGQGS
jgi:bifunctional UDP-N-acetylglucosamine pyrophosphorylase / glucosamine-1-phosphate N-acetyltransferase